MKNLQKLCAFFRRIRKDTTELDLPQVDVEDEIRIVNYDLQIGWILSKFANNLHANLQLLKRESSISNCANPLAAVNHHVIYHEARSRVAPVETLMITHIDTNAKLEMLKAQQQVFDMGICMSRETVEKLVKSGVRRDWLCYVNPAHDGIIKPRPIVFGVLSKVHSDGRKNEDFLIKIFKNIDPTRVCLKIMGCGWDRQVQALRDLGIEVEYYNNFDYNAYIELVSSLDYFLYFSYDEGSMAFLDAISADVKTIVTPQGFHLDVEAGIDYPIDGYISTNEVIRELLHMQDLRVGRVKSWSWLEYAWHHTVIWDYLKSLKDDVLRRKLLDYSNIAVLDQKEDFSASNFLDTAKNAQANNNYDVALFYTRAAYVYNPTDLNAKRMLKEIGGVFQ